jgi:OmpA-OmpF porin, OOP family
MTQRRFTLGSLGMAIAALSCASAANAEGFYFGLNYGSASYDLNRKDFDTAIVAPFTQDLAASGVTVTGASSGIDDTDNGWSANVGYRFNSYVAAEVGYLNLGEGMYRADVTTTNGAQTLDVLPSVRVTSTGITTALLGIFPFSAFDVYGKAGLFFSNTKVRQKYEFPGTSSDTVSDEVKAGSRDTFYGVGATWNFSENYSVRLEYQKFLKVGDNDHTGEGDIDFLSVGVLFR